MRRHSSLFPPTYQQVMTVGNSMNRTVCPTRYQTGSLFIEGLTDDLKRVLCDRCQPALNRSARSESFSVTAVIVSAAGGS